MIRSAPPWLRFDGLRDPDAGSDIAAEHRAVRDPRPPRPGSSCGGGRGISAPVVRPAPRHGSDSASSRRDQEPCA